MSASKAKSAGRGHPLLRFLLLFMLGLLVLAAVLGIFFLRSRQVIRTGSGALCNEAAGVFGSTVYRRDQIDRIIFVDSWDAPREAWDASQDGDRSVLAWVEPEEGTEHYQLFLAARQGVKAPENSAGLFRDYRSVYDFRFDGYFDTSRAEDMSEMFSG